MYRSRLTVLLCLCFCLTACNVQNTRPVQETADLKDVATTQQRAKLAYDAENWIYAEKHYLTLTEQLPRDAEPWFRLGNVYSRLNRPDDAIRAYKESLVRNPSNAKTWHNMGIVQLRQATSTFVQLQQYADADDPVVQRARFVVNAMSQIMEKGFGVTSEEAAQ